jgi:hypothetical protein
MTLNVGRTASEWFAEATRWHVQGHQGCPRCHAQHCVFRSEHGARVEFHCTACDFSVCHDGQTGLSFAALGEEALLGVEGPRQARAAPG